MNRVINKAYLLIGGNMGDRVAMLQQAREAIALTCGHILRQSAVYETAAWGKTDQAAFLNQVLLIATMLDAELLLETILQIENNMGRKRAEKYGPRLMDIDIIFFNDAVIDQPNLKIPHPHISGRRFVLEPLAEIAPGFVHPQLHITVQQMLAQCSDPLVVHKL